SRYRVCFSGRQKRATKDHIPCSKRGTQGNEDAARGETSNFSCSGRSNVSCRVRVIIRIRRNSVFPYISDREAVSAILFIIVAEQQRAVPPCSRTIAA